MSDIALPVLDYGELLAHTLMLLGLVFAAVRFTRWFEFALARESLAVRIEEIKAERLSGQPVALCGLCSAHRAVTRDAWVHTNEHRSYLVCAECADLLATPEAA